MPERDLTALAAERTRLRATYLHTGAARPPTTARGVHHVALLCAQVEQTIQFYQDLLEFPLSCHSRCVGSCLLCSGRHSWRSTWR
jgi:hypothetical protein